LKTQAVGRQQLIIDERQVTGRNTG